MHPYLLNFRRFSLFADSPRPCLKVNPVRKVGACVRGPFVLVFYVNNESFKFCEDTDLPNKRYHLALCVTNERVKAYHLKRVTPFPSNYLIPSFFSFFEERARANVLLLPCLITCSSCLWTSIIWAPHHATKSMKLSNSLWSDCMIWCASFPPLHVLWVTYCIKVSHLSNIYSFPQHLEKGYTLISIIFRTIAIIMILFNNSIFIILIEQEER